MRNLHITWLGVVSLAVAGVGIHATVVNGQGVSGINGGQGASGIGGGQGASGINGGQGATGVGARATGNGNFTPFFGNQSVQRFRQFNRQNQAGRATRAGRPLAPPGSNAANNVQNGIAGNATGRNVPGTGVGIQRPLVTGAGGIDFTPGFGFTNRGNRDDFFFDFFDPGFLSFNAVTGSPYYGYGYRYYDYNNNGLYDASSMARDTDQDGVFDDTEYYAFADAVRDEDRKRSQQDPLKDARITEVQGEVDASKTVLLPTAQHLIVRIQQGKQGVIADLGPLEAIEQNKLNIKEGEFIQVRGLIANVGGRPILMADRVRVGDQTFKVERSLQRFPGEVDELMTEEVRGNQHQMMVLDTNGAKRLVDLGIAADLKKMSLDQGDAVVVYGVPVEVDGQMLVMAHRIGQNEDAIFDIDRAKAMRSDAKQNEQVQKKKSNEQASVAGNAKPATVPGKQPADDAAANQDPKMEKPAHSADQKPGQVVGTVLSMETVEVGDSDRQLAKIVTKRGDSYVVDFGPADAFKGKLKKEMQVTASGYLTRANDQPVLIANKVEIDGETMEIADSQSSARQVQEVTGTILETKAVTLGRDREWLATIEQPNGEKTSVNLGRDGKIDVELKKGMVITARGITTMADSEQVLLANEVMVDNQSYQLREGSEKPNGKQEPKPADDEK